MLRRGVLRGRLDDSRAEMVVEDLAHWPVDRISTRELARLAWQYRHNVGAYDAFYVAAARARECAVADGGRQADSGDGDRCGGAVRASWVRRQTMNVGCGTSKVTVMHYSIAIMTATVLVLLLVGAAKTIRLRRRLGRSRPRWRARPSPCTKR